MTQGMEVVQASDQQAFAPGGTPDHANALIERSGIRAGGHRIRGRASAINPTGRFETTSRHMFNDGWQTLDELPPFQDRSHG